MAFLPSKLGRPSNLCIALDPDPELIGIWDQVRFCGEVIDATHDLVCAYKVNPAFLLSGGNADRIGKVLAEVPAEIPVIFDAKYCDIGNTAEHYADYVWRHLRADACTVVPYFGVDGVEPFLRSDTVTFVVAASSNPSGSLIQEAINGDLYTYLNAMAGFIHNADVGFVAPATKLETLQAIRLAARDQWLLVPGLGAQQGDLEATVRIAGSKAMYVVGRSILFPHNPNTHHYKTEVRERATYYRDAIRNVINSTAST